MVKIFWRPRVSIQNIEPITTILRHLVLADAIARRPISKLLSAHYTTVILFALIRVHV